MATPEWWNDAGLKALSARVVRVAPDDMLANQMRAEVASGLSGGSWEADPRSAAELKEAATRFDRAAALHPAPAQKAQLVEFADTCRSHVEAM